MAVWSSFRVNNEDDDDDDSLREAVGYQLSRKSNPVFRMLLLVLYWEVGDKKTQSESGVTFQDIKLMILH